MVDEQRARAAVEHLQAAALEMISAARALLDVAEEVVREPGEVLGVVSAVADAARRSASPDSSWPAPARSHGGEADGADPDGADLPPRQPKVRRINVS